MRIEKLTSRFADTPKLVRILNVALPVGMIIAVLFGTAVVAWQIVSLAQDGEVTILTPRSGQELSNDFAVEVKFKAAQERDPLNLIFKLDERVINAKVTRGFSGAGDYETYVFRSGDNGVNKFDHNLLKPGSHTIRVEARTGDKVGKNKDNSVEPFDADNVDFNVKNVKNLVTLGEGVKTFSAEQLPLDGAGASRDAFVPPPNFLHKALASLPQLLPKASAHTTTDNNRHGNLAVSAPPGIAIDISPVATTLGSCHEGNHREADTPTGKATFTNCPVSNIGGNDATYNITLGPTPANWTLTDGRGHSTTVTIKDDNTSGINFTYAASANPTPPTPPTGPNPTPPGPPPAPSYDYAPAGGPLIALTKLTATSADVDVFGYQLKDNAPANFIAEISADVDGNRVVTRTDLNNHATHAGVTLNLANTNLKDGKTHSLRLRAINMNGVTNYIDVVIAPNNGTGGAPAGSPDPGGSGGGLGGSTVPPPPNAEDGGDGRIKVTTHVFKDGKATDRIGNTRVVVNAKNHKVDQVTNGKLFNCNPYDKITNTAKDNPGYGQATFDGCWTSRDKKQEYKFNQIKPPEGYDVRSIHLPSDPGKSLGENDSFEVKDGQETAVDIWLNPPPESGGSGGGSGGGGSGSTQRPPAVPTGFRATETAPGAVTLQWNAVPGIGGYAVEKFDPSPPDPTDPTASPWGEVCDNGSIDEGPTDSEDDDKRITPQTSCLDDEAGFAANNKYRISSYNVDADGAPITNASDNPIISSYAETEVTTAPLPAPMDLKIIQTAQSPPIVKLEWQPPTYKVPSYKIQRSLNGTEWEDLGSVDNFNDEGAPIDPTPATEYIDGDEDDETVAYKTRYFYRVASDGGDAGISIFITAEITTAPLPTPTELKITETGPGVIQLDWKAPETKEKALDYVVERSTDQTNWTNINQDSSEPAFTDQEGKFSTKYFYRLASKAEETVSDYVLTEITTSPFKPNIEEDGGVSTDGENATSDDEELSEEEIEEVIEQEEPEGTEIDNESDETDLSAVIPDGAVDEATQCGVVQVDGLAEQLASDIRFTDDPEALVCKNKDGTAVDSFNKPVVLTFKVGEESKDGQVFSLTAARVLGSQFKSGGGAGDRIVTATNRPGVFVVVASPQDERGSSMLIVIGAVAVLVGAVTATIFIRYRMQSRFSAPPDPDI